MTSPVRSLGAHSVIHSFISARLFFCANKEAANDQHLPGSLSLSPDLRSVNKTTANNQEPAQTDLGSACALFLVRRRFIFQLIKSLSEVRECDLMEMVWNKRRCFVAGGCARVWRGVHSVDSGPGEALYSE